ncbi:hypothetical protein Vretimale_15807 [Volvox reticuliferus]|uniref:PIH1D1/2/3 CS-like domain-containing protein n=1 Tax=Volvox reticuliferus TaxID=1737510 RepID=A0A8J4GS32_9CHLO|nr:hypothetical protein Vretimale_15807 [Volvox reticuliferus]
MSILVSKRETLSQAPGMGPILADAGARLQFPGSIIPRHSRPHLMELDPSSPAVVMANLRTAITSLLGKCEPCSDANDAQAKFAHLTPDTLAPGNVEGIIQQRDQLQITASCAQRGPAEIASGDSRGRTGHPPLQQHAAALAMSANILYDINDEDAGVGNQAAGRAASRAIAATPPTTSAVAAAGGPGPSANPKGIQTPEYVLQEVPGGPTRHSQLEILILLPSVSSPEEVHVWLSSEGELQVAVPAKYHLKLELPYPVLDDTSYAKWSKAKKRLTLMLTKKG